MWLFQLKEKRFFDHLGAKIGTPLFFETYRTPLAPSGKWFINNLITTEMMQLRELLGFSQLATNKRRA